jgi:hypothetical protein
MTRTRLCIEASVLYAFLLDGWRIVFRLPMPRRGTEWLMERP